MEPRWPWGATALALSKPAGKMYVGMGNVFQSWVVSGNVAASVR